MENVEYENLLGFLYLCPVGVIKTDLDGAIEMLNPKAAQLLLPIAKSAAKLDNLFDVLQDHAPEVRNIASGFAAPHGVVCEHHQIEIRKANKGAGSILTLTLIKLELENGKFMSVLQDMTTMIEQERALRSREQRLQAIFDGVRDYAIYSLDETGRIETWNKSAERVEGYIAEEVLGRDYGLDYPPESRDPALIGKLLKLVSRDGWHEEEGWRIRRGGDRFWANTMVSVLRESEDPRSRAQGYSVITRDISDRKQSEDALRRLASIDYLTGVNNRRHFFEIVEARTVGRESVGKPLSVIMLDADHFKKLNDSFGHEFGDRALKTIAGICADSVGSSGIVARFGGEEFAILLLDTNPEEAAAVAERIRFLIETAGLSCTASLGVAQVHGDVEEALRAADRALYRAKGQGRNQVVVANS